MLTKAIEVQKYIRASAGRAGISIVFEDANEPRHDGKTIYLPRITHKTTDIELQQLMASVDHEVAHDRFSSFDVLKNKDLNPKGILMFVWNFLEDSRINVIEAKEYQGFRENWDDCTSMLVEQILVRASKNTSAIAKLTTAMMCWEADLTASSFPKIELAASLITPNKKVMDVLNNFSDRLVHCHSILDKKIGTEATYKLAEDILKELGDQCPKELPIPAKPKEGSDDGKMDGKTTEKADGEAAGEVAEAVKSDGKEATDPATEYKVIDIILTPGDIEAFSMSMPEEGSEMSKTGVNFAPTGSTGHWDMTDYSEFIIVDYPRRKGEDKYFEASSYRRNFLQEYEKRITPNLVSQENFAQQVRRLIQIRAKSQTQYGVKKGKLDQSRLSRICSNAPGFNERVFKNKIDNKTLDAAITVLVDMSGSMGGDKVLNALASTLLVNEVCSTLNIPLEILGFTDGSGGYSEPKPLMFIYKSFNDLRVNDDSLKEYFALSSGFMVGNPDGENILWAYDRLNKRKEKKKLLIVMSDGSPAASKSSSGLEEFTRKVITEIEASKSVDIYGLGLCSDAVTYYYKANSVVREPNEIPSKLIELIERKILK
jgi:cobalamin biosynthesis protein CobT